MQDRVFAGIRATGRQHIGNYLGAIQNFVALQDRYECIYSIVDLHSLTTLTDTDKLRDNVRETAMDLLASGIRPEETILYVQSHVPEVSELHLLLSMVTPHGMLLRVPTFKDKVREQPDNINYGLVGYPVLQTADIVLYRANKVPVGEDQLPHLELAREIVRRFNRHFGDVFPEPTAELTDAPMVLGFDNRKMSKSYGNAVDMAATAEETTKVVRGAITDPQRRRLTDPGRPEVLQRLLAARLLRPRAPARNLRAVHHGRDRAATTARACWPTQSTPRSSRSARVAPSSPPTSTTSTKCSPTAPAAPAPSPAKSSPKSRTPSACRHRAPETEHPAAAETVTASSVRLAKAALYRGYVRQMLVKSMRRPGSSGSPLTLSGRSSCTGACSGR